MKKNKGARRGKTEGHCEAPNSLFVKSRRQWEFNKSNDSVCFNAWQDSRRSPARHNALS